LDGIIIKKMETEAEINGKAFVHYQSWQETYPGLVDPAYLQALTEEKCRRIAHRWTDGILVAKDGEQVIGFVGCGPYHDGSLPGYGEVFSLYVLAAYYGRKVGYRLMNAAIAALSPYQKIAVWVLEGNDRAIRFYERYGFRFDGAKADITLGTPNKEWRMLYTRSLNDRHF